jgi:hypothetical protein
MQQGGELGRRTIFPPSQPMGGDPPAQKMLHSPLPLRAAEGASSEGVSLPQHGWRGAAKHITIRDSQSHTTPVEHIFPSCLADANIHTPIPNIHHLPPLPLPMCTSSLKDRVHGGRVSTPVPTSTPTTSPTLQAKASFYRWTSSCDMCTCGARSRQQGRYSTCESAAGRGVLPRK